jgi:rhodanese-related sulfurtransferase
LVKLQKTGSEPKEHIVVDIRDRSDYETGHIAGSVHIPRRELTANLPNLVPDKDKRVIVILGPTEEDEIEAVHEKLQEIGYSQVEYLAGGIDRYCEIAEIGLDDIVGDVTEEEAGSIGDGDSDIDPESGDNEPLY